MKTLCNALLSATLISSVLLTSACTDRPFITERQNVQQNKEIVELQPNNFKPAFTRDTVIKLNSIVSRQLAVVDEYDAMIGSLRNSIKENITQPKKERSASIQAKMNRVADLVQKAKLNLADLTEAEKEIIENKEHYNKATFAGMMDFVKKVEKELSTEQLSLNKNLVSGPQIVNK